ncbi:uncharacterized protein LOC120075098 [Benincasa hispida]|uniref:uncharacterized protein LOC120075098 n=1 Tax=Benincasa hispida TaxID=102211 RepID=UPI0019026FBB|nr:uncharacterized protein LOC120075098 [Benincasa hispida]XP_038884197.1 uncharacterized protein LOC120075098 [Benincasa hispida]XP_038884198.1 uncharacterized protein LOC120075098 [Benincasa hispida]
MGGGTVEVVSSKGCSRLIFGFSSPLSSLGGLQQLESMSLASPSSRSETVKARLTGPFTGLVICVTGLSKEARKQVKEATERLGGLYSPNLHPQCTHLVVQSLGGRKFEHAFKHGSKNGLFVVSLGWFVDSVRRNVRLSESLYNIKSLGENSGRLDELNQLVGSSGDGNSCLPVGINGVEQNDMIGESQLSFSKKDRDRRMDYNLSGQSMYIDTDISPELQHKVIEAAKGVGAALVDQWFAGCSTSHVVCERTSIHRYLGHSSNLVTPLWVLKTVKEKCAQRLIHMSADLARQISSTLEDLYAENFMEAKHWQPEDARNSRSKATQAEREKIISNAKLGVRKRRACRMQTYQNPIRPLTPSSLLDSICWSTSEPSSSASIYTDSFSSEGISEHHTPEFFDATGDGKESEASFANLTRPLSESEKSEVVFKNHYLTILFPVDRFFEMGPSSRTFFSNKGFTCFQILDHIYAFYQENMSEHEIEMAIHTDSRHADRLRSVYCSRETTESGHTVFKRIEFLGSRRSFEMLKRVSVDNNSNVYELLIRA